MNRRRLFRRIALVILVLAALGGGGVLWLRTAAPQVDLTAAARGPAVEAVYATGVVEPENWAKVAAVQPGRIAEILVAEGETVRKGQVLARLDDREAGARVAELEAKAAYWREQMSRSQALVQSGVRSRDAYEKDKSELNQVTAAIAASRQRRADLVVVAPIDGVVLRRDFEVGEVVGVNDALFWVGGPRPLRLTVDVDEEDIPRVMPGQKVLIKSDSFPGRVLTAQVGRVTPKGDPINKTFRVRVALPEDSPLMVGMTCEVNVVTAEKPDALLIPAAALVDGKVFVIEDGRAASRPVGVGIRGRNRIEITEGLAEGDRVIAAPAAGLKPGDRLRAKAP